MEEEGPSVGVTPSEAVQVISVLEEKLEGALLLADPTAKSGALKALILSQEAGEEDLRVKDHAITELLSLYVATGDVQSTTALLAFLRPYFSVIPKARTAKQVRSVIESLARIPNSTEAQVALCMETIEWCKAEKRSFLRLRIQLKLSQL
jgi:26S proteasome regulatory subunit N6